jgi:hypothetical protein
MAVRILWGQADRFLQQLQGLGVFLLAVQGDGQQSQGENVLRFQGQRRPGVGFGLLQVISRDVGLGYVEVHQRLVLLALTQHGVQQCQCLFVTAQGDQLIGAPQLLLGVGHSRRFFLM